ncbi:MULTISPECIES: LppA family lipoprotein [Saccharopolyspora]|uniref:LppA family lipoprotein n=1 Tax=Saccharopolyspora TaxID=1835 RepID=UPI000B846135|nr:MULTISPECIES: LppA family lipoprotein [Saccharopolyspora]
MILSGSPVRPEGGAVEDPRSLLRLRPSIEEISAQYGQLQQRLRDRLHHELGPLTWVKSEPLSQAGCDGFPDVPEAEAWALESWQVPDNLPDASWPRAVDIVRQLTREYGFGEPEIIVDRSGDHEITANDEYGAVYRFSTAARTVLAITTGCHLRAAAKG